HQRALWLQPLPEYSRSHQPRFQRRDAWLPGLLRERGPVSEIPADHHAELREHGTANRDAQRRLELEELPGELREVRRQAQPESGIRLSPDQRGLYQFSRLCGRVQLRCELLRLGLVEPAVRLPDFGQFSTSR